MTPITTTRFGFLLDARTFVADVPATLNPNPEACTSVGLTPAAAIAIQCAPSGRTNWREGWRRGFVVNSGDQSIVVYELEGDRNAVMPVWDLGRYTAWMQLRPQADGTRSELLGSFVNGLVITVDASGIPRVALRSGVVAGNPSVNPMNRDQVMYYGHDDKAVPWSVAFRRDDALGKDEAAIEANIATANVTTKFGVTVLCAGPSSYRDAVGSVAASVAASLALVE